MRHFGSCHHVEKLRTKMTQPTRATGTVVELARVGFRVRNEFGCCLDVKRRIYNDKVACYPYKTDGSYVANGIIGKVVQGRVGRIAGRTKDQCVTIRLSADNVLGADGSSASSAIIDNDRLYQRFGQLFCDYSR